MFFMLSSLKLNQYIEWLVFFQTLTFLEIILVSTGVELQKNVLPPSPFLVDRPQRK